MKEKEHPCITGYIYCIQDMSLVLVHSCVDIWSTKISNQIFFSGNYTDCPYICEAQTLCSLSFVYTNMCYYRLSCQQRYPICVFSHPSIYIMSVLQLGKPIISRQQSCISSISTPLYTHANCYISLVLAAQMASK